MKLFLINIISFFIAAGALAQIPNYYPPVPLNMGDYNREDPNVNNILFFQHPAVPFATTINFRDSPSHVKVGNEDIVAYDLAGAPGFPPNPQSPALGWLDMLATTAGLCYENFLPTFTCDYNNTAEQSVMKTSWSQLVADLRNTFPGEETVPGAALPNVTLAGDPSQPPYLSVPLGSIVGTNLGLSKSDSSPAVCYDITAADDWLACPVFGEIYMANGIGKDQKILELQSPIIIYRKNEKGLYRLAGYLGNPSIADQNKYQIPANQKRFGNVYFPVAIASGNFEETADAPGAADIAVVSTTTLPHWACNLFTEIFSNNGRGSLPHGVNCSYGYTWVRKTPTWDKPPRDTFEPADLFPVGPKTYDLATGYDQNKAVLFAPSGAPVKDQSNALLNHFYVYKYYDAGVPAIEDSANSFLTALPHIIPPKAIEVIPPVKDYAPFKIATADINNDGYADFAITWKSIAETRFDTTHNLWEAQYSPYVSVYVSTPPGGSNGVGYKLLGDFTIPQTELAAVSFIQEDNGQKYLVVGNQKRIQVGGVYHAFDYVFGISGGVVDTVNVKPVQVSFKGQAADAPGVGDITTDPTGNIGSVLRKPFIPAPEGCDIKDGQVYGPLWPYQVLSSNQQNPIWTLALSLIDGYDGRSTPNRCKCPDMSRDETTDQNSEVDDLPVGCKNTSSSSSSSSPVPQKSQIKTFLELITKPLNGIVDQLPTVVLGPCGGPANTFSGPATPCDFVGKDPREVTAVMPKTVKVVCVDCGGPPPPPPPQQIIRFTTSCVAKVGREDPKKAAVFEEDQKRIREANDKVQSITGIKDFDIFVGGEAGEIHWECPMIGGAFASASKVVGALPNVSGNLAPFAVWQTSGVQPLKFTHRPTLDLAIQKPLRLTPMEVGSSDSGSNASTDISRSVGISSILPNVSSEELISGDNVQFGDRSYNINGKVMIKALEPGDDFVAAGTSLSVGQAQSLFTLDFVAYPALLTKTVQNSQLSFEAVYQELQKRVAEYQAEGKPITIDIYRNLPWEETMKPEFLIAQGKLPDAVTAANLALQPPSATSQIRTDNTLAVPGINQQQTVQGPITNDPNQVVLPAYILPPGLYTSGGGCGCHFHANIQSDVALFQLFLLLIPLCGVIYYRHSLSSKSAQRK